jgi:hypothetical protein
MGVNGVILLCGRSPQILRAVLESLPGAPGSRSMRSGPVQEAYDKKFDATFTAIGHQIEAKDSL